MNPVKGALVERFKRGEPGDFIPKTEIAKLAGVPEYSFGDPVSSAICDAIKWCEQHEGTVWFADRELGGYQAATHAQLLNLLSRSHTRISNQADRAGRIAMNIDRSQLSEDEQRSLEISEQQTGIVLIAASGAMRRRIKDAGLSPAPTPTIEHLASLYAKRDPDGASPDETGLD